MLAVARIIGAPLLTLLGPVKRVGSYRVPRQGGLVVIANHIADIDPVIVQYACPRPVRFMAKSELFEMKGIGWLARLFGAFPVKRGEPDREAIRASVSLLQEGHAVGIFPEGQLSEKGELAELKSGVALIIRMAKCQVICCGIKGSNRIIPYGSVIPRPAFGGVSITWGEPRSFEGSDTNEIMAWIGGQLRDLTT